MTANPRHVHPIYDLFPVEIDGVESLAELALDLRSLWNHATDEVWRRLDAELWENTHNPWVVLQTVSRHRLEQALGDVEFRARWSKRFATFNPMHARTTTHPDHSGR